MGFLGGGLVVEGMEKERGCTDFSLFESLDVSADAVSYEDEGIGRRFCVWAY